MGADQQEVLKWLVSVPVGDLNFKLRLNEATAETIRAALAQIEGEPNTATKQKTLESALRKIEKNGLDPVSEAAMEVVDREQNRELSAKSEQEDRERRIAEAYEIAGRIQSLTFVEKVVTVTRLVQLQELKNSKVYRELPNIGTWDKYCEYLGLDRHTIDQHLLNLATFGDKFLETCHQFSVSHRSLRKLRQLTNDGSVVIDAEFMVIGEERIPLDADHKEELQTAIETLVEQQATLQQEVAAQKKAFNRVQEDTHKSVTKLQKELDKLSKDAESKGLTPTEDAFCQKCDNARTTIDGFLNQFDPSINPLPEDASPRMRAKLMHTLDWFRRCIHASFDTANDLYGDPEIDDDWVPPNLRPAKNTDTEVEGLPPNLKKAIDKRKAKAGQCQLCRSAHPTCDQCCKVCPDKCNGAQACRLEA